MKKKLAILFVLICALAACRNEKNKVEIDKNAFDTLTYRYDSVTINSHKNPKDIIAKINYPIFSNQILNKYINNSVFLLERDFLDYKKITSEGIDSFDCFFHEQYFTPKSWSLNMNLKVIRKTNGYIAIKYIHTDYINNKPNGKSIQYFNFNLKKNNRIELDSLISDGKMDSLSSILETTFRRDWKISKNDKWINHFYYDEFKMPYEFYINNYGLVFQFMPYELKKFDKKSELFIPFIDLKSVLKPNIIDNLK